MERVSDVRDRIAGSLVLAALILGGSQTPAGAQTPAPGEYATEQGWGTLHVARSGEATTFAIQAIGANAHTCQVEGEVRNGQASLEGDEGKACIVTFAARDGGTEVSSTETCRYYCGARAQFDGLYLQLPEGCSNSARTTTRDRFKRLYDQRRFADARAALKPLLERCGRFLPKPEDGWVRNDLALTEHRLGDDATCRRTLAPLTSEAAMSDENVAENYAPSDADAWLPVVRATRTNLKLCGTVVRP